jgi:hypothetical protein
MIAADTLAYLATVSMTKKKRFLNDFFLSFLLKSERNWRANIKTIATLYKKKFLSFLVSVVASLLGSHSQNYLRIIWNYHLGSVAHSPPDHFFMSDHL